MTEQFSSAPGADTSTQDAAAAPKPLWKKKRVLLPASALGVLVLLGVIGAAFGPPPPAEVRNAASSDAAATEQIAADRAATEAAEAQAAADRAAAEKIAAEAAAAKAAADKAAAEAAAAEQAAADKAAADKAAADKAAADKAAADAAAAAAAGPSVDFAMPSLVGENLQVAQNVVQTHGVFYSLSHDLLGMRMQVMDGNWKVCDQTPAAGTRIQGAAADWEGRIDFGVVKLSESCP